MRPSLEQLQQQMIAALYGEAADIALRQSVRERPGVQVDDQLDLYRHATQATLQAALRISYPVVARLVGASWFDAVTRAFVRSTPSQSGDLERYGAAFGDFLSAHAGAEALPYLADVARLEWLLAQLRRAAKVDALSRDALAALPADRLADVRVRLLPQAALFHSPFPAWAIWQQNRDPLREPEPIDAGGDGDRLLLHVADEGFSALPLSPAAWAFFQRCGETRSLTAAAEAAWAIDPCFDLVPILESALRAGVLGAGDQTSPSGQ